ncbi:hypothetical protein D3C78_783310 [compost metagenome]
MLSNLSFLIFDDAHHVKEEQRHNDKTKTGDDQGEILTDKLSEGPISKPDLPHEEERCLEDLKQSQKLHLNP